MLFGYPIAATQDNWLHECLCKVVHTVHEVVDAGKPFQGWPDVLPVAYRAKLKSRWGLRDRVKAYDLAIRQLTKGDRQAVLQALEAENRIPELLSGTSSCATLDGLPEVVREPVADLFGFAFELLSAFDVRDEQYAVIYAAIPDHVCPFCGTEYFDPPGAAREALDHYLTRSRYPFAAANLRNLVPMGHKCNSRYKLATDILMCANGQRRVAFDPYNHATVRVSLDSSQPFGGTTQNTPSWNITFEPSNAEVLTWDQVFSVCDRYRRDHLDQSFPGWLGLFGKWARREGLRGETDEALVAALRRYEEVWAVSGLQDRAFLKAAVFRMLRCHCESGDQRLKEQLRKLMAPIERTIPEVPPTGGA